MDVAGDYTFDAPRELVWDALQDPNVLGSIMPGGQKFEKVGENQYNGVLLVKVGPVQGTFQGQISISDIKAPESYQMTVDGKGAPGFVKATGGLRLEPRDSQTFMSYSGQAQIGGRIASVGQRLLDSSVRSIIRQSLDALNEYLKAEVGQQGVQAAPQATSATATQEAAQPGATTTPTAPTTQSAGDASASTPVAAKVITQTAKPVGYKPPSQTSLALNVARDVLNDMIPAKYQPVVIGGVVVVIILIILLIAPH